MIKLIEPEEKYLDSYYEAFCEYKQHGITSYSFTDASAVNIFEKFARYRNETNLAPGRVGAHFFWLVDDERDYFIGEVSVRHHLNEALEKYGGHIGYGVRFSEWNKGFGTKMLELALSEAKRIGLSKVLITCDDGNVGSARVMEKNGFILQDKIKNAFGNSTLTTRRYWKTL